MLILTRRKDESMIIDDQIVVKVLKVKGNRVRLGIEAADSIKVRRGELKPIEAAQLAAAATDDIDVFVPSPFSDHR